jgi:hypothetical protein
MQPLKKNKRLTHQVNLAAPIDLSGIRMATAVPAAMLLFIMSIYESNAVNAQTVISGVEAVGAPENKTIPFAQAAINGERTSFRRIDGVPLSSTNSNLPVAADEGLWRESKGLPIGSKILLSVSDAKAPADGKAFLRLKIELFDKAGNKITAPTKLLLETTLGRFQIPNISADPAAKLTTPTGQSVTELSSLEIATANGEAQLYLMSPVTPGEAKVRVSSGAVGVQGDISFVPDLRSMLVVGIVEGAINFSKAKGPLADQIKELGFDDNLRNWNKSDSTVSGNTTEYKTVAGRVAFFAKGEIKGEYLLTAALDTDKITSEKLFRDIDPNAFYRIYGDASIKQYDAQSRSRLYVRVDKDKSYLLYGDYSANNADEGNKLASYNRSLTGGKWHYESQTVKANLFAAYDDTRGFVDEQPGRGISGPYALAKPNAIANSEQVELLVRDRNQPAIVLARKSLARFVDYDFEPFSGRILFRQPVPSVDENANPVSIRISYEVDEGGDKHWVGGLDAKIRLSDSIAVGAAYAEDKNPTAPYKVYGVNSEIKLGERTYLVGEFARTEGNSAYNRSLNPLSPTGTLDDVTGRAARVEMRHDGDEFKGRVYAAKAGAGFQNSNAGLAPGRQEAGARGSYQVNQTVQLSAEALQTRDESATLSNGARRTAANVGVSVMFTPAIKLEVGVNKVNERVVNGLSGALSSVDTQAGDGSAYIPGWGFLGTGLLASPATLNGVGATVPALVDNSYTSLRGKVTGQVSDNTSVFGEYEQALDDGSRKRAALGGEYRFNEKSRAYARHELENSLSGTYGLTNDGSRHSNTVFGVDTAYMQDGQLFSEYRMAGTQAGNDAAAAVGLRNTWRAQEGLNFSTSLERQQIRQASGNALAATAFSWGVEYTASPIYKLGGKLEYRTSDVQDQILSTAAYDRKLSDDWAMLGRNLYLQAESKDANSANGKQTQDRAQIGLAYRDTQTNKFHGLARLEYRTDKSTNAADLRDEKTWITSLHGNYKPNRAWTYSGQLGFKDGAGVITNDNSVDKFTGGLISGRVMWDFAERYDASLYGSQEQARSTQLSTTRVQGLGSELGYRVMDNLWLSGGYTWGRFADVDLFSSNTSWNGFHLRVRWKFDEKLFASGNSTINRNLDEAGSTPRQ